MRLRLMCLTLGLAGALCLPAVAQYAGREEQPRHDQDDQNRARGYDNDQNRTYGQNEQWRNTKAYQEGMKDGRQDRDKNRGERVGRRHWKNDQDRQAYEAGYYESYRGNGMYNGQYGDNDRRDRDNDRDRDQHNH